MPIDVAGIVFLVAAGVLLPWGAVRSARRLDAGARFPGRGHVYLATLAQQLALVGLALWAARANDVELLPVPAARGRDVLLAGALLVLLLALVPWRWRSLTELDRARLLPLLPRTSQEKVLYAPLAMVAGIGEELVYRGAMFALLERLTGNTWAAALLAAASFAVGHAVQGAATAALVGVVALAFQGLAAATGALYAGMTVHVVFDLSVGLLARRTLGGPTFDVRVEQKLVDGSPVPGSVQQEQLPAEGEGDPGCTPA